MNYKIKNQDEFDQFVIDEVADLNALPSIKEQTDAVMQDRGHFVPLIQVHVVTNKDNIKRVQMFVLELRDTNS